MFAKSPSAYLGIDDPYMSIAIDLACAGVVWTDDNYHTDESKETVNNETTAIGQELEDFQRRLRDER